MSILFIISYLLFMFSFLRMKKTTKKLNILLWIFISIMIYMGFNSIIIYILSTFNISATLLLRSIINIFISIIMFVVSKEKQKYFFDKKDIGFISLSFILSLIIFIFRFSFDFNINFIVNDTPVHFAWAKAFIANDIYNNTMSNVVYNVPSNGMFFSSTNTGTFLEILKPITGDFYLFKSFIIFEMLSYFLSGVLFYFIIKGYNNSNKKNMFTILILFLYQMGYPLLNLLYGFHYWGLIILVISTIIITIKELVTNKMYNNPIMIIMLFIQLLSVFITYYLYVPVIYAALGFYFLYLSCIKKEITLKRSIVYITIILIIPFIFGMLFFNIIGEYFMNTGPESNMSIDGYNYKNLLGNIIYILPLFFYNIYNEIKKHQLTLVTFISILNIIYLILLFILCMKGIMSNYYFSKIYNLLWLNVFICLANVTYNSKENFVNFYVCSYIIISIFAILRVETILNKFNPNISSNTIISNIGNIYDKNIEELSDRKFLINKDTYELLNHVKEHEDEYKNIRGEIPFIALYYRKIWSSQILDIVSSNKYNNKNSNLKLDTMYLNSIDEIKDDYDVKYFVWIPDKQNSAKIDINDYTIIYENECGYVLKK